MKRIRRKNLLCITLTFMVLVYFSYLPQPISADFYVIPVRTVAMPRVKTIQVDCNAGQTINSALEKANPGDTIQVQGTCNEKVTLISPNHDRLKIDGLNTAIIDGGGQDVIEINSAQGVTINGLTVQNGNDGIIAKGGAAFIVEDVTASNNADEGIEVDANSTALLKNCTVEKNGDWGIGVYHSNLYLNGSISCNNNNSRGIGIFNSSNGVFFGATITTNGNDRGIQAHNSSSLGIYGSTLTTNNNERGILISNSSSFSSSGSNMTFEYNTRNGLQLVGSSSVYTAPDTSITIRNSDRGFQLSGSSYAEITGTLFVENSGDRGFQLHGSSHAEITGTLLIENSNNKGIFVTLNSTIEIGDPAEITVRSSVGDGYGILMVGGSSVNGNGGSMIVENNLSDGIRALRSSRLRIGQNFYAQIRNNGRMGIWLDDGSTAVCSNPTITGNQGGDVLLEFGSRAKLYRGTIGTVSCDGTVLIKGDYVCP